MSLSLRDYLEPGTRVHLVGIGGVSMSALGEVLKDRGIDITGSDMNVSDTVLKLRKNGITVFEGHDARNIEGCACVIRTAAARDDNPEIQAARSRNIPVFERAQAWGVIMSDYRDVICFSGTHGKTTSSSMCTQIFLEAGLDPTVMIGGTVPFMGGSYRVGQGSAMIAEACEYCNSFLNFCPTVAVINNIEGDHLDFFKDLDDIKNSFRRFSQLVPERGRVIINADDPGAADVGKSLAKRPLYFGFGDSADVRGVNYREDGGLPRFDVYVGGELYTHVELAVRGRHNAYNALAALSAASVLGVDGQAAGTALGHFTGAERRLQFKGRFNGADIYDDYAHHPGELKALFDTAMNMGYKRVICVFQPHTYSRTKALLEDFIEQLSRPDLTVLAKIYAAREKDTIGVSSEDIRSGIGNALYFETFGEIEDFLRSTAGEGDLILTVGAGNIYQVGEALLK